MQKTHSIHLFVLLPFIVVPDTFCKAVVGYSQESGKHRLTFICFENECVHPASKRDAFRSLMVVSCAFGMIKLW
jgi:hypothetical protein